MCGVAGCGVGRIVDGARVGAPHGIDWEDALAPVGISVQGRRNYVLDRCSRTVYIQRAHEHTRRQYIYKEHTSTYAQGTDSRMASGA